MPPRPPKKPEPVIKRLTQLRLLAVHRPRTPQELLWQAEDAIPRLHNQLMTLHGLTEPQIAARLEIAERESLESLARDGRRKRNAIARIRAEIEDIKGKGLVAGPTLARATTLARWLRILESES